MMMNNTTHHLELLSSAISDVGRWSFWQGKFPSLLQLEFSNVQLWNPPEQPDRPPSSMIALQFKNVQSVDFLNFAPAIVPLDWPERMAKDEWNTSNRAMVLLNAAEQIKKDLLDVKQWQTVHGLGYKTDQHFFDSHFQCLVQAGDIGVVVSAELLTWRNHTEKNLPLSLIEERSIHWWEYYQAYWKSKQTNQPFVQDPVCEATIPIR